MKQLNCAFAVLLLFPALVLGGEKEETYLKEIMTPQARELLLRIGQTNDLPSTTNQVQSYHVDNFDDGWLANLQLTNGWSFRFLVNNRETNVSILHPPSEIEAAPLKGTLIPLARDFLRRVGLTNDLPAGTNQVQISRVNYFSDRPGYTADLRLTNGYIFSFVAETNKTEVWSFQRPIKTYYELNNPPKEKVEALKALNLQNKLNKESAAALATKYFKLLGHKEEDFHPLDFYPPEITQGYWVSESESPPGNERREYRYTKNGVVSGPESPQGNAGNLPYYEIT